MVASVGMLILCVLAENDNRETVNYLSKGWNRKMAIIKGTTPTIIFTFSEVDVANITTAYLVIKQNDEIIIEKPLTDAVIREDSIEWKLTQLETLSLTENRIAEVCCDWKLADGTRGRSNKTEERVEKAGKNGVI